VRKSKFYLSLRARLLLSGLTSAALVGTAHGQGQTTSPSQQPPGEVAGETQNDAVLSLPQVRGLLAPSGAEDTKFVLGAVVLEGGQPDLNAQAMQAAPSSGSTLSVAELFEFAGLVQRLYFEAGYPLVRVVVPAQDIKPAGGDVRILIVNGYIDGIDSSGLPGRVAGQVEKMLAPLVGDETITASELERRVLLAGDTDGLSLRTALTPGEGIGATTLVVTGEHRALETVVSIDNRVIEEVGREQVTFSAAFNSVLGAGEQFVLTTATALSDPGLGPSALRSYAGVSASAPVGVDGWSVGFQAMQASNAPDPIAAGIQFENEFFRAGVSTSYALKRTRKSSASLTLGFDASFEEQRLDLLGQEVSLFSDRTRVIRAGLSGYQSLSRTGALSFDAQLSRGLDGLGARAASDASNLRPLSRDGTDAAFTKLAFGATAVQKLSDELRLQATVRAQSSFNAPLLRSEQTSFVSPGLVSGPPSGLVTGDRMVAGRFEAQSSVRVTDTISIQPYLAVAAGESHLERATALERDHSGATSAGIGLRSQLQITDRSQLALQLEWASLDSDDTRLNRDWLGFSVSLRY
jgi:hemolysin activation/secretion protein